MITRRLLISSASALVLLVVCSEARAVEKDESAEGVIPSPNQEFGDNANAQATETQQVVADESLAQPMSKLVANVPVYVSPYARAERSAPVYENQQESSHAPANYAHRPATLVSASSSASGAAVAQHLAQKDLKAAASHGHGHHGYDHSGWLDMGAWTGGKGSFGWYADYPVGSKHGHGKRR